MSLTTDLPGTMLVAAEEALPINVPGNPPESAGAPKPHVGALSYFEMEIAAAMLDDVERVRVATGHRIGAYEREGLDGIVALDAPRALHAALLDAEHQATLELRRVLWRHPLGPWVKATVGVGEKQGARLIAAIGDPYMNFAAGRPRRGPAELWAYCGLHTVPVDDPIRHETHRSIVVGRDQRPRRRRGQAANWNVEAKTRAFLVAESCIKHAHSPYRPVYDRERAKWADRPTTDGHRHLHALGVVAKAVLKDLFNASKHLHADPTPKEGA